jgi:hypothetical protein
MSKLRIGCVDPATPLDAAMAPGFGQEEFKRCKSNPDYWARKLGPLDREGAE